MLFTASSWDCVQVDQTLLMGRMPLRPALTMAADVAEALAVLHEAGVVHRDVKPGNVLIDREGRAVLFDLGLAHVADDPALTRTGDYEYWYSPVMAWLGAQEERIPYRSEWATLTFNLR